MASLFQLFSYLYTMAIALFDLLLLKAVLLIRSVLPGNMITHSDKLFRIITTQYFNLVEEKNPTIRYTENLRHRETRECAVCLSEFLEGERMRKLKCKHAFHKDCLDRWLEEYPATCPLCRTEVLPEELVANYHLLRDHIENGGSYDDAAFLLSVLYGDGLRRLF
uniref:RING-type domain-containing protein n=1 Tax=Salix viminalis TaxID=40686 RepID=A0A6N2LK53_SALVM